MSTHVVVVGPVSKDQIGSKIRLPEGWTLTFFNHAASPGPDAMENGSTAFATLCQSFGPDPLSRIAPGASRVILGSFSAGHGFLEVLFTKQAGDSRLAGVACADSYYTSKAQTTPKPGYLAQTRIAANGGPPFLMTSSNTGGPGYLSSSAACKILASSLGATIGNPGPPPTYQKGNWLWNDMGDEWTHVHHAMQGLPDMLDTLIGFETSRGGGESPSGPVVHTTVAGVGGMLDNMALTVGGLALLFYMVTKGGK